MPCRHPASPSPAPTPELLSGSRATPAARGERRALRVTRSLQPSLVGRSGFPPHSPTRTPPCLSVNAEGGGHTPRTRKASVWKPFSARDPRGATPGRADGSPPGPELGPRADPRRARRGCTGAQPLATRDASAGPAGFAWEIRHTVATSCVLSSSWATAPQRQLPGRPPARLPHSAGLACTLCPAPRMPAEGHSAWWLL